MSTEVMEMKRPDPLKMAHWTEGAWAGGRFPEAVSGFSFDTRTLRPGDCFVALRGGARDGHAFLREAAESGAAAAVVEETAPVDLPQLLVADSLRALGRLGEAVRGNFPGPVVGVTGSCGKTSTKDMLQRLLGDGRTHATPGNWNNLIGVPMTLLELDPERQTFAVVEAGINQTGEMDRLAAMIRPDVSLVTHVGEAHLEGLGSVESVAWEKSRLVENAAPESPVFLPASVYRHEAFSRFAGRAIVVVREDEEAVVPPPARVRRYHSEQGAAGTLRLFLEGWKENPVHLASASEGLASNAALALFAARELGVSESDLRERMAAWQPASDRGRWYRRGERDFYVDCYNANPPSMLDAVEAFERSAPPGRARCYILGTMEELGAEGPELHRRTAARLRPGKNDRVCFVGPDPLTEAYREGARQAGIDERRIHLAEKPEELRGFLDRFNGSVFIKGSRSRALETLLPAEG